ncbi:hemerythrin domain-containing protein [Streptomyces liangshanensis]|uniref:Hemerythrin domain-containing protein n=2 Tax=Streptomyces liangshanensis TaxID=2717324 RepID=A0A6G9H9T7_9ACTN|nr:hemerythrin domain-containing protein [Streptomyces liangshanensis]
MADVRDMYTAHVMLRREFRLLPGLVRGVPPGDIKRAKIVATHAEKICLVLHLHHEGEDLVLWPLLLERGGEQTSAIVPTMEEQHHGIETALRDVTELLAAWKESARGGELLAASCETLSARLQEHMAMEEERILPLVEEHVTAAEWAQLGEHGLNGTPKQDLPLVLGMVMYEGDPLVLKEILSKAPLAARLVMPFVGPRVYARHARRVYGTPTPPRVGDGHIEPGPGLTSA